MFLVVVNWIVRLVWVQIPYRQPLGVRISPKMQILLGNQSMTEKCNKCQKVVCDNFGADLLMEKQTRSIDRPECLLCPHCDRCLAYYIWGTFLRGVCKRCPGIKSHNYNSIEVGRCLTKEEIAAIEQKAKAEYELEFGAVS